MGECLFRTHFKDTCDKNTSQLTQNKDKKRIESIIKASKIRGDTLHESLSDLLKQDSNLKVDFHYSCVSKYCSPKTSKKEPPNKKSRRSEEKRFDPKTQCLYCGELCEVKCDSKHPE